MPTMDADDIGDARGAVHNGCPPEKGFVRLLNKSANPSPQIPAAQGRFSAKLLIVVSAGLAAGGAGPIPEGRPCVPRPSAVLRTAGHPVS